LPHGSGESYHGFVMWSVILILVLLIPLTAVILDSRLGRALARRIEGGAKEDGRVAALEAEVDRLGRQLEQLQEQAEFLNRLLEERTEAGRPDALPGGDRPGD
jgi:predicted Holliday junction resolvase-like endonuclease